MNSVTALRFALFLTVWASTSPSLAGAQTTSAGGRRTVVVHAAYPARAPRGVRHVAPPPSPRRPDRTTATRCRGDIRRRPMTCMKVVELPSMVGALVPGVGLGGPLLAAVLAMLPS
jgi:hypothetical protein